MEARDLREEGDYNDFYVANEKDASKVIAGAKIFLSSVSDFFAGVERD